MDIQTYISLMASITIDSTMWMLINWQYSFPVLFVEYVILMKLWSLSREKSWERYYKVSAGLFFVPQDIVVNLIPASLLFLDPPPKNKPYELVTWRMTRYKSNGGRGLWNPVWLMDWRVSVAYWLCNLLNPHQQKVNGQDHC